MATHDYDIANQSGANFRADLNNCLDAIVSNNSSSSAPSTTFAYMLWVDTSNNLIKLRNSANNAWITLPLSTTTDNTVDINGGAIDGTAIGANAASTGAFTTISASSLITANGNLSLLGTTPTLTIGDGGAEDTKIVFDGNAQDYYIGLDDSADDLIIGKGSTVGTTPAITIDENLLSTFAGAVTVQGAFTSQGIDDNADATAITIDSSENVGIGTTSPANKLHVSGNVYISGANTFTDSTSGYFFGGNGSFTNGVYGVGTNNMAFNVNGSERMRIDSSGNVGIGVTNQSSYYSKALVVDASGGEDGITIVNNNNTGYLMFADGTSGLERYAGLIGYAHVSDNMNFHTAGLQRMRIDSTGNVLIGTTVIDLSAKGFLLSANGVNMYQVQEGITSSTYHVYDTTNNNYKFYVGYNGTISATNTNISGLSDERLKENIRDLDKGLNDILKLKPRLFDWKEGEGSETKDVSGFVAQECEEAGFDEFVGNFKHKELDDAKSFGQGGLIPALVKAIQEQQTLIEDLQTQINNLRGK